MGDTEDESAAKVMVAWYIVDCFSPLRHILPYPWICHSKKSNQEEQKTIKQESEGNMPFIATIALKFS